MDKLLYVGVGGFIGASLRYLTTLLSVRVCGESFPYGTLAVNVIGCFLIGLIMELSLTVWNISEELKVFLVIGVLGGLTTFSTFGYETMEMFSKGRMITGLLNVVLNVFLCLASVGLGRLIVHIK